MPKDTCLLLLQIAAQQQVQQLSAVFDMHWQSLCLLKETLQTATLPFFHNLLWPSLLSHRDESLLAGLSSWHRWAIWGLAHAYENNGPHSQACNNPWIKNSISHGHLKKGGITSEGKQQERGRIRHGCGLLNKNKYSPVGLAEKIKQDGSV